MKSPDELRVAFEKWCLKQPATPTAPSLELLAFDEFILPLVEALEFYAAKDDCWVADYDDMSDDLIDLKIDAGDVAQKALADLERKLGCDKSNYRK